jgi:predicted nucleic acid-binding Zn finger protein
MFIIVILLYGVFISCNIFIMDVYFKEAYNFLHIKWFEFAKTHGYIL